MQSSLSMGKEWTKENKQRQQYLDWLYEISNRASREHPFHSLYTNLIRERKEALLKRDMHFYANSPQKVCQ